ncbi:DUF6049 family protein [Streptomyces qinzhouensis]|uniref:Secreted protein n=1 Tax=Streptomyces qinzhouensis TaxID=2599401 RepID=A0A5B8J7N8_9ACTN|nr:DUF6049 family protein [Streptomyces qinzhouensis]QDY77815.1 hypothetical protein FQU76_16365 [Streptomyces qinzhouensis]
MAEAADFRRMTPAPARRWLRRAVCALATAPMIAGLLGASAPVAQAAPAASSPRSVDVSLTTVSPSVPEEDGNLTVSGTVVNKTKGPVTSPEIDLHVGQPLNGRTGIDRAAKRTGYDRSVDGPAVGGKYTVKLPSLAPGISRDFTVSVPVEELGFGKEGVYQLGVSLSGRSRDASYRQVLGIERTFLPWQPDTLEKRTRLTYLWPLISSTHLTSEVGSDEQRTPVFEDESLAKEIAPEGRLGQMVSLGRELPVTWVIDPDLLATVDAMTRNYRVKDGRGGEETVPGRNQAVAKQWLSSLETAIQNRKVIALPYADPDLASLAHRGTQVSGTLGRLVDATEVASLTVETILHVKPSVDFAWPVDGAIDSSIVNVATSAGADHVIARSDSLRDDLPYTASAARPIGGGTTAVVADARLSKAFEGNMLDSGESTLAVQRFLAQTLAVARQGEAPGARSIVVAPQRMPTTSQAQTMARALQGLAGQRWTQQIDLLAAAEARPDSGATRQVPPGSQYPEKLRKRELPESAFEEIRDTQETLDNFTLILTARDRVEPPFSRAIDREMSTSWRGHRQAAETYRAGVRENLGRLVGEVQLIEKSQITLSGRSATIPVTVQNRLVQDIDHLVLRLSSDNGARLSLDGGRGVAERPIEIKGGHSQSVKFDAKANANGQVRMTAQLYTEDGKVYGPAMQFTVKVSEATPTVLLVIAGGVLLLVLAGVRMYTQRKRAAARDTPADGPGTEPGGDGDPDGTEPPGSSGDGADPGQPSDPTPDTRPESGNGSRAGEKVDR